MKYYVITGYGPSTYIVDFTEEIEAEKFVEEIKNNEEYNEHLFYYGTICGYGDDVIIDNSEYKRLMGGLIK